MSPIYRIVVAENLETNWSDWFDGLTISSLRDGMTMMMGPIRDSAALYGILSKARDLNLTLLALNRLERMPMQIQSNQHVDSKGELE